MISAKISDAPRFPEGVVAKSRQVMCPLEEYASSSASEDYDALCQVNARAQVALERRLARQSKEATITAEVTAEWGEYRAKCKQFGSKRVDDGLVEDKPEDALAEARGVPSNGACAGGGCAGSAERVTGESPA